MKKIYCLLLSLFIASSSISSQDVITSKNGERIVCKITDTDSLNVYFMKREKRENVNTFLPRNEIQTITYKTRLPYVSDSDSIIVRNKMVYYQSQAIDGNRMLELVKSNNEAGRKLESARAPGVISYILSYAGGFCIGWPIGTLIGGGEPEWGMVGAGAGLVALAIPFSSISVNRTREAINIYNQSTYNTATIKKELRIGFKNNGISLSLNF